MVVGTLHSVLKKTAIAPFSFSRLNKVYNKSAPKNTWITNLVYTMLGQWLLDHNVSADTSKIAFNQRAVSWNPVAVKSYSFNMFQIQGNAKLLWSFKAWNLLLWKIRNDPCHPKSFGTFEKRATGSSAEIERGRKYRNLVTSFETIHQALTFWLRVISLLAGYNNLSPYLLMVCCAIIKDKPKTGLITKGNTKTAFMFNCYVLEE